MLKNKKKKKGFTLIELIIVIAIIAILAAIAIPKFGDIRRNAALKSDVANAKVIANAASALIAEGTIAVPSSTMTINVNTDTANVGDKADDAETSIASYLQSIPKPESSGYDNYKVSIDKDGNVTVTMTGTSAEKNLYPGEVK